MGVGLDRRGRKRAVGHVIGKSEGTEAKCKARSAARAWQEWLRAMPSLGEMRTESAHERTAALGLNDVKCAVAYALEAISLGGGNPRRAARAWSNVVLR